MTGKAGAGEVGLCSHCRHARIVETPRSRFWHCARAAWDPRLEKYPRLPVLTCPGYEDGDPRPITEGRSDAPSS
jgi:hypothetical protein